MQYLNISQFLCDSSVSCCLFNPRAPTFLMSVLRRTDGAGQGVLIPEYNCDNNQFVYKDQF